MIFQDALGDSAIDPAVVNPIEVSGEPLDVMSHPAIIFPPSTIAQPAQSSVATTMNHLASAFPFAFCP